MKEAIEIIQLAINDYWDEHILSRPIEQFCSGDCAAVIYTRLAPLCEFPRRKFTNLLLDCRDARVAGHPVISIHEFVDVAEHIWQEGHFGERDKPTDADWSLSKEPEHTAKAEIGKPTEGVCLKCGGRKTISEPNMHEPATCPQCNGSGEERRMGEEVPVEMQYADGDGYKAFRYTAWGSSEWKDRRSTQPHPRETPDVRR